MLSDYGTFADHEDIHKITVVEYYIYKSFLKSCTFIKVKEMELTTERMINHYKKCTGLTEKKIRKFLLPPQDVWLSAEEAKALKLCDKIEDVK